LLVVIVQREREKGKGKGDKKVPMGEWSALVGPRVGTRKMAVSHLKEW
jgi:hypothetical protein